MSPGFELSPGSDFLFPKSHLEHFLLLGPKVVPGTDKGENP